jgi:serine/threonine protein kinase
MGDLSEQDFLSGQMLDDKYRIEKLLGQGGMGAVYRATHLGTKRTVAIKVIHPQFSNNEEFVERFRREAEAAGRLCHPNVVDVTDFGFAQTNSGRVAYLVMEYLDGCTLGEILDEEERLPTAWVVDILEQVCSAVDEAHRLGIIHRDLKPDNIWLEPNRRGGYTIKVLDFGLVKLGVASQSALESSQAPTDSAVAPVTLPVEARQTEAAQVRATASSAISESPTLIKAPLSEEAATLIQQPVVTAPVESVGTNESLIEMKERQAALTRLGSVMGTPLYMSPEQCRGESLDARSDIYSLGVIAYRMLTGATPFDGSANELIRLHTTSAPQPIREKNSKVPKGIARLVMSALAKDPTERPASAAGFASALRASVEGSGTLLRHAVALYSERFPTFLKVSLLAYLPLIAIVALMNLSDKFIAREQLSALWGNVILPLCLLGGMLVTNLLAYATVSAVTVPIVIQAMIAPLRPIQLRTAFAALRRRWLVFSATTIVILALILFGSVLFIVPGALVAICYALYAPVVVMEGAGVRATLKRARRLMRRSWKTVLIITVLQFALPILVWSASIDATFTFKLADDWSPKELGFNFGMSNHSELYQLLNIFVTPLTAIMTALLYLKTRQAGGESLKDAIEQFDALEIPRSRWQARMRSRASASTSAKYKPPEIP